MKIFGDKNCVNFEYYEGGVMQIERIEPELRDWRMLPFTVTGQIEGGPLCVLTESDDGTRMESSLGTGDALCIAPGVRHLIARTEPGPDEVRWSHFDLRVFSVVNIFNFLRIPVLIHGETAQKIGQLNMRLGEFGALYSQGNSLTLAQFLHQQALGYELAALLIETAHDEMRTTQMLQASRRISPVFAFIDENLARPLSVELLARQIHISQSRFHTLFKEATHVSPASYVQNLRLQHAQRLLLNTDTGVAEIAAAAGFSDIYHFSHALKKRLGISPLQYRRQMRSTFQS